MLSTDYTTLTNAKKLINQAKNRDKVLAQIQNEARTLFNCYIHEDFMDKMMVYIASKA